MAVLSPTECPIPPRVNVNTANGQSAPADPRATRIPKGVSAIIAMIIDTVTLASKRQQSRRALRRLTNDQLWDIGLERRGNDFRTHDDFLNRF